MSGRGTIKPEATKGIPAISERAGFSFPPRSIESSKYPRKADINSTARKTNMYPEYDGRSIETMETEQATPIKVDRPPISATLGLPGLWTSLPQISAASNLGMKEESVTSVRANPATIAMRLARRGTGDPLAASGRSGTLINLDMDIGGALDLKEYGVTIEVDRDKCTGCTMCEKLCPANIYFVKEGKAYAKPESIRDCFVCRACEVSCPVWAIAIIEKA